MFVDPFKDSVEKELTHLKKMRESLNSAIRNLENILGSPGVAVSSSNKEDESSYLGGHELAICLVEAFKSTGNKPMAAADLLQVLKTMPDPVQTSTSRITAALYHGKIDYFEKVNRGFYKLKEEVYKTLTGTQKDKENPNS